MINSFLTILSAIGWLSIGNMSASLQQRPDPPAAYRPVGLKKAMTIDGNWDKDDWKSSAILRIEHPMGDMPKFTPVVEARMAYDKDNAYVIFRVQDRYVRSVVQEYNGNVSGDSCVEFFFAPDPARPLCYFNLEVNAGGTPLIFYITKPMSGLTRLIPEEISQIEIAHSLPKVVYPEIEEPVTWTIECRIPFSILEKYTPVARPAPGVQWKANFYKTGSRTSSPNYLTWSPVAFPRPNFHLPDQFGTLRFE
jgi:Carbohydrate-binding family 9